jgi:glycosyltransferase involved in cell wall biosynthesis
VKILHVIPSLGPLRGGPTQAIKNLCRDLAQAGADVTLATTDDNGPGHLDVQLGTAQEQDGYRVIYFRRTTQDYTFSCSITPWLAKHVADYDFVHAHAVFSYAPLIAAFFASFRKIPYTFTPHGLLLNRGIQTRRTKIKKLSFELVEKRLFNRSAFIHVTSLQEAQELKEWGVGVPIEVVYFGLEAPPVEQTGHARPHPLLAEAAGHTIFLFLGRFHPIKALDLLIPAFARAARQEPGMRLALAGRGEADYEAWLTAEIAAQGIEDRVLWLGFLDEDAKWQALADADVVLLPSYSESFGLAAVEALACGTPVIVSDQVVIHEEILQAQAGRVVPCQIDPLAGAMLELARDAEMRRTMGQHGKLLVEDRFNRRKTAAALLELYRTYGGYG